MQKLKVLTEELKLNSLTHTIPVVISWDYEDQGTPDIDFDSEQDKKDFMNKLDKGELVCITVFIEAKFTCETGNDNLGFVIVRASHFEQDILETVKDYNMIDNAMNELKENIFVCFNQMRQAMGMH